LEELKAAVAAEDDAVAKVLVFLTGLPDAIAAAVAAAEAGDDEALQALTLHVAEEAASLTAGLAAAAPPPAAPPEEPPPAPVG